MATKYLYLDDEETSVVEPFRDRVVAQANDLTIDIEHPGPYKSNFSALFRKLKEYRGLILDWRLDVAVDANKTKFDLRAAAVAQEIRTTETEKKTKPIPIVIWSQQDRLKNSFSGDTTSHDLFDSVYKKEFIIENAELVHDQLISLAKGYETIAEFSKKRSAFKLSDLLNTEEDYVDIRLQEYFKTKSRAVHDIARILKHGLLDRPGLLIDEKRLAAKLGIDKDNSKGWLKLVSKLRKYKYSGPFHDGWQRWWAYGIEKEWWFSISGQNASLSLLNAQERVQILKQATQIRTLVAASPIIPQYHTRFYTICEHYQKPLDPVDGVIIAEKPEPWQERRYLSLDAALKNLGNDIFPDATETERLKTIRKGMSNINAPKKR